ncbi:MAG: FAD-binding oxidoreductase, partial [Planctomycetia bacterium]
MSDELGRATPLAGVGEVVGRERLARDTFRLRVRHPELARRLRPGQFVMVRAVGRTDPLLARPFALYDVVDGPDGRPESFDVVYLVQGNGTRCLSGLPAGAEVAVWGPLGNTFPTLDAVAGRHLLIVAGGIGQTPFV